MPVFPALIDAPRATSREGTFGFIDYRGKRATAFAVFPATATDVQLNALRDALGEGSNAAQLYTAYTNRDEVLSIGALEAYDEAEASVTQVAVFQFQNATGDQTDIELPAPDTTLFYTTNREAIDPARARSAAIIAAALAGLNSGAPAGTYTFSRGFLATRRKGRGGGKVPVLPALVEPGGADLPAPGDGA